MKIILIILVLIVVLAGLFIYFNVDTSSTIKDEDIDKENFISQINIEDCNTQYLVGGISGENPLCYYTLGLLSKDSKLCNKIESRFEISETYCDLGVAVAESDKEFCYEQYSSNYRQFKGFCLSQIGIKENDLSICNEVKYNREIHERCFDVITKDSIDHTDCLKINESSNSFRDNCYKQVAKNVGDPSICENVEWDVGRDYCMRDVVKELSLDLSTNQLNVDLCDSIVDEIVKSNCLYEIAKKNDDISICEDLSYGSIYIERDDEYRSCNGFCPRDECYAYFAIEENSYEICDENVNNSEKKAICYGGVAGNNGDSIEICDDEDKIGYRNDGRCKEAYYYMSEDLKNCELGEDPFDDNNYNDQCIKIIAKKSAINAKNNNGESRVELCNLLEDNFQGTYDHQVECAISMAFIIDDVSVCDGLSDESDKEFCEAYYKIWNDDDLNHCLEIRDEEKRGWCLAIGPSLITKGDGLEMPHKSLRYVFIR